VKLLEEGGNKVDKLLLLDGGPFTLHYVTVKNEKGEVEMKHSDHSSLHEEDDTVSQVSSQNIDLSGIRELGLHFYYAEYLMVIKHIHYITLSLNLSYIIVLYL